MRHIEIQEFFVEGSDQRASHVLLHITEPNTPAEFAKGYFFALAEMKNGTMAHIEQLQRIIDDLEAGFYTDHGDTQNDIETLFALINRRSHKLLSGDDFSLQAFTDLCLSWRSARTSFLSTAPRIWYHEHFRRCK